MATNRKLMYNRAQSSGRVPLMLDRTHNPNPDRTRNPNPDCTRNYNPDCTHNPNLDLTHNPNPDRPELEGFCDSEYSQDET